MSSIEPEDIVQNDKYKYGFVTNIESDVAPPGLNEDTIRFISAKKQEPEWLLEWRLKAYRSFLKMREPSWAHVNYEPIDLQAISYFAAPKQKPKQPPQQRPQERRPQAPFPGPRQCGPSGHGARTIGKRQSRLRCGQHELQHGQH